MRLRSLYPVAIGLLALGAALACTLPPPPSAPSSTTVSQNVNVNIGNPSPTGSPSPGAGGTIHHVSIFNVGTESGGPRCVSTDAHVLHIGCTTWYTCTPKFQDGTDVPEAVHGPAPDRYDASIGASFVEISERGPFDLDVKGKAAGTAVLSCVVKGVVSRPFDITVLN